LCFPSRDRQRISSPPRSGCQRPGSSTGTCDYMEELASPVWYEQISDWGLDSTTPPMAARMLWKHT